MPGVGRWVGSARPLWGDLQLGTQAVSPWRRWHAVPGGTGPPAAPRLCPGGAQRGAGRGLGTGLPVHRTLAPVPGQQPLVEEPGERRPLPPRPLGLLQEHEVVVGLAQAGVLELRPPAEEQLGASPQKAAWKSKARAPVRGLRAPRGPAGRERGSRGGGGQGGACHPGEPSLRCRHRGNSRIRPARDPGVVAMK